MSLFSWFSRKPKAHPSKGRPGSTEGASAPQLASAPPAAPPEGRRNERMVRRELLYTVVRDSMVRAGILSSGYKFKVLSLDQRGAQFLVMVDLTTDYGGSTARLSEIEHLITQTAKSRFDILVTSVYWRSVSPAGQKRGTAPVSAPINAPVAAAQEAAPAGAAANPETAAPAPPTPPPGFEPIAADEVAAFREALQRSAGQRDGASSGAAAPRLKPATPAATKSTLLGFEDTIIPELGAAPPPVLGVTQYGKMG